MGKILLIGDSITQYMPHKMIGNGLDIVYNRGIENVGVETYRKSVLPYVEYRNADVIIVLLGVNNILRPDCDYDDKETLDDLVEKIQNLITDILKDSKGKLIVQSIYPTNNIIHNQKIEYVNKMIAKYCKDLDVRYIDFYNILLSEGVLNNKYSYDGLHLNYDGYELVIKTLNREIELLRKNTR